MKRTAIAMFFWFVTSVVMGQVTAVQAPATSAFTKAADLALANLDRTGVTSGILYDRVFPTADLLNPFGSSSPGHFRQAYSELYAASYNTDYRITPDDLKSLIWKSEQQGIVPIGVLSTRSFLTYSPTPTHLLADFFASHPKFTLWGETFCFSTPHL